MTCRYPENDVALYVEGDLPPAKACEIVAHLADCPACRDLAEELRDSQALLKGLRRDTVSVAALSSVRARVLAEISGSAVKSAWRRWVYAVAGAVFVLLISFGVISHTRRQAPRVQQIVNSAPLPSSAAVPLGAGPASVQQTVSRPAIKTEKAAARPSVSVREENGRPRRQGDVPTKTPAEPLKPLVVKLLTDDPNIVIYWLVDQTGGTL